jgi:hypothetical protein
MGMANDFPVTNGGNSDVDGGTRTITRTITIHFFIVRPDDESYLGPNSVGFELMVTPAGVGKATIIDRNHLIGDDGLITYDDLWNGLVNSEWFGNLPRVELYEDDFIADVFIRGASKVVIQ